MISLDWCNNIYVYYSFHRISIFLTVSNNFRYFTCNVEDRKKLITTDIFKMPKCNSHYYTHILLCLTTVVLKQWKQSRCFMKTTLNGSPSCPGLHNSILLIYCTTTRHHTACWAAARASRPATLLLRSSPAGGGSRN